MSVFFLKSFINLLNTDVVATKLLWYGAVIRIAFVSYIASDVSDVSCFGPSP